MSEAGKVAVVAALVTAAGGGFFTLMAALIPVIWGDGKPDDKPSAQAPPTTSAPATPGTPPAKSWGYLGLLHGRNAAQLQAADAPSKVEHCVRQAQVGGFTEAQMSKWPVPPKTVLCVVTDQGNVVKAQFVRFVGGNPDRRANNAPQQIEFKVTTLETSLAQECTDCWRASGEDYEQDKAAAFVG
ncbi:hypothetical protein ACFTWD_20845 [Streptomyces sp. NPDC056943]|uniref:hypothetical protein n=1 Tax=Streptomyces sp. NPDC056943 TaxID=3345971 RepID=UPI00362A5485